MKTIQSRLKSIREEKYGQRGKSAIARDLGINMTRYDYYEHDGIIPVDLAVRLLAIHGVNPRWLYHGEGKPYLHERPGMTPIETAAELIDDLWGENDKLREQLQHVKEAAPEYQTPAPAWEVAAILREGKRVRIRRLKDEPGPMKLYDGEEATGHFD